jgi:hypothetical protein
MVMQVSQTTEPVSAEKQLTILKELKSLLKEKSSDSLQYTDTLRGVDGMMEMVDLIEDYEFTEALHKLEDIIKRLEE